MANVSNLTSNTLVSGSSDADTIINRGENVTIAGGDGADSIVIGSEVSTITFADLDIAEDSLTFEQSIESGSLSTRAANGNVTLSSDAVTLIFDNVTLVDLMDYSIGNGDTVNTISQLVEPGNQLHTHTDIVFIVDNTSGMSTYIDKLQSAATEFISTLRDENVSFRLGLIEFGDINNAEGAVKKYDFTSDTAVFLQNISQIASTDGGDEPESGLEAIMDSAQGAFSYEFRDGADKRFIVVTDASYHNQGESGDGDSSTYLEIADVLEALQLDGVALDVIGLTESACQEEWEAFVNNTGGTFYNIGAGDYATIFGSIVDAIINRTDIDIDLSEVGDGETGYFIISNNRIISSGGSGDSLANTRASLVAETLEGDTILGSVGEAKIYTAVKSDQSHRVLFRQNITVPADWSISATDNNDVLHITGDNVTLDAAAGNDVVYVNGYGALVTGGDGVDQIIIGSGVSVLTIADLDVNADVLSFELQIGENSLETLETNGNLSLFSESIALTFSDTTLDEVLDYSIGNGETVNSIGELLAPVLAAVAAAIDLSVAVGTGYFVVSGFDTLAGAAEFYAAAFTDTTVNTDIVVGEITADHVYSARRGAAKQRISVNGGWLVTATNYADQITVSGSNATINAGAGDDSIGNSGSFVEINGGSGDDSIAIGCSDVTVHGGLGDDKISIAAGGDHIIEGGDGSDTYVITGASTIMFANLNVDEDAIAFADGTTLGSMQYLEDGTGVTLNGNGISLAFQGQNVSQMRNYSFDIGDEKISFEELVDSTLDHPDAAINLSTAGSSGFFIVDGFDVLEDGEEFYTAKFVETVSSGEIVVAEVSDNVYIASTASGRQSISVDGAWNVTATNDDDRITVSGDRATIRAGAGNDSIGNSGSFVEIDGGTGDDSIAIGCSDVTVHGGLGDDKISINGGGDHFVSGDAGSDTFVINGASTITFVDLDTAEDSLALGNALSAGALQCLEDGSNVTLQGDGLLLVFQDKSRDEMLQYTIDNGGETISFSALIESTIEHPSAAIDLSTASTLGSFVVDGFATLEDGEEFHIAEFVETLASSDIVVGEVSDNVYAASTASGRQSISVNGAWNVTATNYDDRIVVNGDRATINAGAGDDTIDDFGSFVMLNGGTGNDAIAIGCSDVTVFGGTGNDAFLVRDASTITFGDLDTAADSLALAEGASVSAFAYSADVNGVTLDGGELELIFSGKTLAEMLQYTIDNVGNRVALSELIESTIENPAAAIDLSTASNTGFFVVDGFATLEDGEEFHIAEFVETLATSDIAVGDVSDHVYSARSESGRQSITAAANWNVTATEFDDVIEVLGSNATIAGADGADSIFIGSNVSTITFADLNTRRSLSADALTFASTLEVRSFSVDDEGDDLRLYTGGFADRLAGDFSMTFKNAKLDDLLDFTVESGGESITIADLLLPTITPGAVVDLSTASTLGYFVVDGRTIADSDSLYAANFTAETTRTDLIVGDVADHQYAARSRQYIYADNDNWSVLGSDLADTIFNVSNVIAIGSGEGDDYIYNSGSGNVTIGGGDGNDTIYNPGGANVYVEGGSGADSIRNSGANSTIEGGDGDDTILNTGDDVSITGGAGSDQIRVAGNNAYVSSGDGSDLISIGADVSTITFVDLDTAADTLTFASTLGIRSFSVDDSGSDLRLYTGGFADDFDMTFENTELADLLDYTVRAGSSTIAVSDLLLPTVTPAAYVDLSEASDTGVYVVNGTLVSDADALYTANFTASTARTDLVVGDVADHVYSARSRQYIYAVDDNWSVLGSDFADTIVNTSDGVSISGGGGSDLISIGAGVSTITFGDLDTSADSIRIANAIATGSLWSLQSGSDLILSSTSVHLTFAGKSLSDVSTYVIDNGGTSNSIAELLLAAPPDTTPSTPEPEPAVTPTLIAPAAAIDLAKASSTGVFVVNAFDTLSSTEAFYTATLKTAAATNDIAVGSITADHVYSARSDLAKQSISADDAWEVSASDFDDVIEVLGSNATIFSGSGADSINVGASVSAIAFGDLDTTADALSFATALETRSFFVDDSEDDLILDSDRITLTFAEKTLSDLSSFTVDNGGTSNSIAELIYTAPSFNPSAFIDLDTVTTSGVFVVDGRDVVDSDTFYTATFVEETVRTDLIVGDVAAHSYAARSDASRQALIVSDAWNVSTTAFDDEIKVLGSNATINAGDGNDSIIVTSGVSTITFGDLDTAADALIFESTLATRSFSVDDAGNDLRLYTDDFSITFENAELADLIDYTVNNGDNMNAISDLSSFTVDNGGTSNSIAELIYTAPDGRDVIDSDSIYAATFTASTARTDLVVGDVADHVYSARSRQAIVVDADWNVTGSDAADLFYVTGDNATIDGADGSDAIYVTAGVSAMAIANLDTAADALMFEVVQRRRQRLRSAPLHRRLRHHLRECRARRSD